MSDPKTHLEMKPERYDQMDQALRGLRQMVPQIRVIAPAHIADRFESLVDQASGAMSIVEVVRDGPAENLQS